MKNLVNAIKCQPEKLIIWLAFFSPFVVFSSIHKPFENSKYFYLIFVILLLLGYTTVKNLSKKPHLSRSLNLSKLDIFVGLAFLYFELRFAYSPSADFGNFNFLLTTLLFIFYFFLGDLLKRGIITFDVLLFSLFISGILDAIIGILQYLGYISSHNEFFKVSGFYGNPGPYAVNLGILFSLSIAKILFTSTPKANKNLVYLAWIFVIFGGIAISVCSNRTALCTCIFSLFLALYLKFLKNKKSIVKILSIVFLFFLAYLILINITALKENSSNGRVLIWKISMSMINERSIDGMGYNAFKQKYNLYQAEYFKNKLDNGESLLAGNTTYAYNDFIEIAIEYGLLGIILLFAVIYIVSSQILYKGGNISDSSKIIFFGLFAWFIAMLFSYPTSMMYSKFVLCLLLASFSSFHKTEFKIKKIPNLFKIAFIFLVACLLCYSLLLFQSYRIWKNAKVSNGSLDNYKYLYPYLKGNGDFLLEYGRVLYLKNHFGEAEKILHQASLYNSDPIVYYSIGDCETKKNNFELAEKNYLKSYLMIPNRLYPRFLLLNMYKKSGDDEKLVNEAYFILTFSPKIISPAIIEMKEQAKETLDSINLKYE